MNKKDFKILVLVFVITSLSQLSITCIQLLYIFYPISNQQGNFWMKLFARALRFASIKHQNQVRKQGGIAPFINHPIEVVQILSKAGIEDEVIMATGILHDTLQDTDTTVEELEAEFGSEVSNLVRQCSDQPGLSDSDAKRKQISKVLNISDKAKLIKMADKISNNRYVLMSPPSKWSPERRMMYFIWSQTVCDNLKGVNEVLDKEIDSIFMKSGINSIVEEEKKKILENFFQELYK